jgi:hypothetical protein
VTIQNLLSRIVTALDSAGIPYMLTGSYASSLHSIPRATRDLDIVIFPNREQLFRFVESLSPDEYYSDLEDAIDSLRRRSQFNVIDYMTGWKVDFIIPSFTEFNLEEFERRRTIDFEGLQLSVVSPEDIVVAKMLWAKAGESDLQIRDAASVVRLQGETFDLEYVQKWVRRLDLEEQWAAVQREIAG